jgi:hypothetical protein
VNVQYSFVDVVESVKCNDFSWWWNGVIYMHVYIFWELEGIELNYRLIDMYLMVIFMFKHLTTPPHKISLNLIAKVGFST